eukprot:403354076
MKKDDSDRLLLILEILQEFCLLLNKSVSQNIEKDNKYSRYQSGEYQNENLSQNSLTIDIETHHKYIEIQTNIQSINDLVLQSILGDEKKSHKNMDGHQKLNSNQQDQDEMNLNENQKKDQYSLFQILIFTQLVTITGVYQNPNNRIGNLMQYFRLKAASPVLTVQNISENQKDLWDKISAIQQNQKDFPLINERKDSQNFKIRIELQPLNLQQHQVEQALNNYKSTVPIFLICNRVIESVSFNEKKYRLFVDKL